MSLIDVLERRPAALMQETEMYAGRGAEAAVSEEGRRTSVRYPDSDHGLTSDALADEPMAQRHDRSGLSSSATPDQRSRAFSAVIR